MLPPSTPTSRDGIRELLPDEIESVRHLFEARGAALPDPQISTFVGAVRDGKVVGFLVLQARLHAQPMWIEDGQSGLFQAIVSAAERVIVGKAGPQWVYLFAPAGRVSQLAQTAGMQLEPWVVLSKLVQPQSPAEPIADLMTPIPAGEFTPQGSPTRLAEMPVEGEVV